MSKESSNMNDFPSKMSKNRITGIALLIWAIYLLTLFQPEGLWGVHYIAFLPSFLKYGLLLLSLFSILYYHFIPFKFRDLTALKPKRMALIIACVMGLIYYSFPIHESVYGDSELFREKMGEATTEYSAKYLCNVIDFKITNPKIGNTTVLSGVRLLSYAFGLTHKEVFRILGAVSGFLFVLISLFYVHRSIQDHQLKIIAALLVVLTPFSQLFFGYEEIYAPAFPAVTGYIIVLLNYLRSGKKIMILYLIALYFLCLKFHSVFILLTPSLILSVLYRNKEKVKWLTSFFTWKRIALFVLLPILLFGTYAYFFVFKDYNDPRFLGPEVDIYSRLFLPIITPEPPFDNYTLFGVYHFLDYFNMMFLWSGGALFVLITVLLFYRKKIQWNDPAILILGITLILFVIIYFAYNPLMSMPLDFDLFSLGAPVLVFFSITLLGQLEKVKISETVAGGVIALSLLCLPIYMANSDEQALSYRMENVGKYVFKSYWIRAAGDIDSGIRMLGTDRELYLSRYLNVLEELKPYALEGNDREYAVLLWQVGVYYRKEKKDYRQALQYHLQSRNYDQTVEANYVGLMECYYYTGEYDKAYEQSLELIRLKYPGEQKAYRIAIDCAIHAQFHDDALMHLKTYLAKWQDADFLQLKNELEKGSD